MDSKSKMTFINSDLPQSRTGHRPLGIRLRLSDRKLLLVLGDMGMLNIALLITLAFRHEILSFATMDLRHWLWFISLNALWLIAGTIFDIYNLSKAFSVMPSVWSVVLTSILTTLGYLVTPFVTPSLPSGRLAGFALLVATAAGVSLWRLLYAKLLSQPEFLQRALIIGAGGAGAVLVRSIVESSSGSDNSFGSKGYFPLGFIDDDPAKQGTCIEGVPILGTHREVRQLVEQYHPDELIVAITNTQDIRPGLFKAILDCREMGMKITSMADLYERLTGKIAIEQAGQDLSVCLPTGEMYVERLYEVIRRLIDLLSGALGCLILVLFIPPVWLGNRFSSPGPLFYLQERVGQGGRKFRIYKFRSMVVNAEQHGAVWAAVNDPRTTPMGRFLRKSRIDEIPQFINVLKGDMSLIGPRPERPEFVDKLTEEIPYYRARHAIKPGLTGWAQVKYRYSASVDDAKIKLQYDLYYIKHQSLYLDVLIMLKTVRVVLLIKGQ